MAKQVSKTVIGGFVVSAIALLIIGVAVFGGGKFFKETEKYVLFFDKSLKGLNVGSPVVFRGVKIGSVESVMIRANTQNLEINIPVFIEIELDRFHIISDAKLPDNLYDQAKMWIDHGLRCQLNLESLVTGQLMVEMDFYPKVPARLTGIDVGYPELPTMPSEFEQLSKKLKNVPIEKLFEELLSAVDSVEKTISSPELMDTVSNLKEASSNMNKLILDFTHLVDDAEKFLLHVDGKIDPLSTGLQATIGDARKLLRNMNGKADKLLTNMDREIALLSTGLKATAGDARKLLKNVDGEVDLVSSKAQDSLVSAKDALDQANRTLKTYEGLVDERSELANDLNVALDEIAQAARSIRSLTDYLEQHPESLIKGKGPGGR